MLRATKIADEYFIVRDIDTALGSKAARCNDCPHDVGDLYHRDCSHPDCITVQNPQLNAARAEFISELIQLTKAGEPIILIHEITDLINFGVDPDKIIDLTKSAPKVETAKIASPKCTAPQVDINFVNQIIDTLSSWEIWWNVNFEIMQKSNLIDSVVFTKPPILRFDSEYYKQTACVYRTQLYTQTSSQEKPKD